MNTHINRQEFSGNFGNLRESRIIWNEISGGGEVAENNDKKEKKENTDLQDEVQDDKVVAAIKTDTQNCVATQMNDVLTKKGSSTLEDTKKSLDTCTEKIGDEYGLSEKAKADLKGEMNPGTINLPYEGIEADMNTLWADFQKSNPFLGTDVKVVSAKKLGDKKFRLSLGTLFKDKNQKDAVDSSDFDVDMSDPKNPKIRERSSKEQLSELRKDEKFDGVDEEKGESAEIIPSVIIENGKFIKNPAFSTITYGTTTEVIGTQIDPENSHPEKTPADNSSQNPKEDCKDGVCIVPNPKNETKKGVENTTSSSENSEIKNLPEYLKEEYQSLKNKISNTFTSQELLPDKFTNPVILIVGENCQPCRDQVKELLTIPNFINQKGLIIVDKKSYTEKIPALQDISVNGTPTILTKETIPKKGNLIPSGRKNKDSIKDMYK